jgi:hypothetical protein
MRWVLHVLAVLACFAEVSVSAQDDLDDADAFLRGADDAWVVDDGVDTEEMRWNPALRGNPFEPRGVAHFGVQVGTAAVLGGRLPELPLAELGFVTDIRYVPTQPWRLRFVVVLAYEPEDRENLGGGAEIVGGGLALSARVFPFAVDLGDLVTLRVGGEIGVRWALELEAPTEATGGVCLEGGLRLLDGRLEINLVVGTRATPFHRRSRNGDKSFVEAEAVLGGNVGVLFP